MQIDLAQSPLFARLERAERILIAGAGGGFDVFSGLPLFLHLRARGKQVFLANLSFTNLAEVEGRKPGPDVVEVLADTPGPDRYFPERALCRWFSARGEQVPVFAIPRSGGRPLTAAYELLQRELGFDAVVLVDGGTDLLLRGDEADLGTPQEDITSLAAVDALEVPVKLAVCLGFGVDRHHGVCHAHFLENVAALSREGGYLGVTALLPGMPEVDAYREAVRFAAAEMPHAPSIVSFSVLSAIEGDFGDVHRTARTLGSTLFINPLVSMYWAFELSAVARRCLYLEEMKRTETPFEAAAVLEAFRNGREKVRPWMDIPV
jgi:hypothetical protein